MNFDFTKFAGMNTNSVGEAFGAKPQDVIADIASEVAQLNGGMFSAPDVDIDDIQVDVAEEPTVTEENAIEEPKTLTPEEIKSQAEQLKEQAKFLREQKAKSEKKEESKSKKETKKASKPKKEEKKEEPVVYSRPRKVVAYGDEVYVEQDANASLEDIRNTLVTRFGYSEFKDSNRCQMRFDARTGEVYPEIIFNKKG